MSLRHIVIPSWPAASPPRLPTYELATRVQTVLQRAQQAWKTSAAAAASASDPAPTEPPPPPYLISFTPAPTYTLGRRQTSPLSAAELARLRAPLRVSSPQSSSSSFAFAPEVAHAPRGGLATYHGPGQVVLWPVVDLRSPLHARRLGVRDYTRLLEATTVAMLRRLFGIAAFATENPGVWIRSSDEAAGKDSDDAGEGEEGGREKRQPERKISALGVHLSRHVAGLGVAVNLGMPVVGADEFHNPWARIVPCGLRDRGVTTVAAHLGLPGAPDAGAVADVWAEEFAAGLGLLRCDGRSAVEQDEWAAWERRMRLDGPDDGYVEGQALQT
ncbi:hypothetical protein GGR52DRAFT_545266 [Hypoxylon sp. FL1284]|nr:hypothetical protein GGR52DRAFT_545266 [Hypoxylon sp. FL1284]